MYRSQRCPNTASGTAPFLTTHRELNPVEEGDMPVPHLQTVLFKNSNSIAGHGDIIEILRICQDDQADYEGELVVITDEDVKNVYKESVLGYVLGCTVGSDASYM